MCHQGELNRFLEETLERKTLNDNNLDDKQYYNLLFIQFYWYAWHSKGKRRNTAKYAILNIL